MVLVFGRKSIVVAAVIWTLGAGASQAQRLMSPEWQRADILEKLQSDAAQDVAWGAFSAGQYRVVDAVPAILERLRLPPVGSRGQQHHTTAALLDALIQLE